MPNCSRGRDGDDAQQQRENQSHRAICPDARILHDFQPPLCGAAPIEAVSDIGQTVLVQTAAGNHQRGDGKRRRQQDRQVEKCANWQGRPAMAMPKWHRQRERHGRLATARRRRPRTIWRRREFGSESRASA
jgi:hypothetical protein